MNDNNTTMQIAGKVIGVIFMLMIAASLQTPGVLIDLLLLGIYYEAVMDSKDLAKDVGYDESDLKKRIEELEKKIHGTDETK